MTGIIESGLFRSERYQLEERTTDPASTSEGEMWFRVDLAPEAEQLATLRVDAGSEVWDVPIYDVGATTENVSKAWRVQIGGSTGFVPITDAQAAYSALRYQHDSAAFEAHDALEASVIPDSGDHQWPMGEGSGTVAADSRHEADMDLIGPSWISGTWVGGYATEYDGVDDHGVVDDNRDPIDDVGTVFVTGEFRNTDSDSRLFKSDNVTILYNDFFDSIRVQVDDFHDTITPNTNTKYRVALRWDSGDAAAFVNGVQEVTFSYDNAVDLNAEPWYFGSLDGSSQFLDGLIDNPIVEAVARTDQEIQDDYNNQPWS